VPPRTGAVLIDRQESKERPKTHYNKQRKEQQRACKNGNKDQRTKSKQQRKRNVNRDQQEANSGPKTRKNEKKAASDKSSKDKKGDLSNSRLQGKAPFI
jgi:hypothetical protein